jgi:lipid A 4'-phosphatase
MIQSTPGLARVRLICLALALLLAPIAIFFPIDHRIAGLFYEGGGSFWLHDSWVGYAFHDVIRPTFYWVLIALLVVLAVRSGMKKGHRNLTVRRVIYVLAVVGIGLGLVTNLILKNEFDRPRPLHTLEYGGAQKYQPPILPTKGCERNCSFVSGDASAAFAMIALPIAFATGRRRRKLIRFVLWAGVFVGLLRMMNGSHYLFDVTYAGLINVWIAAALYKPILKLRGRHIEAVPTGISRLISAGTAGSRRLWHWLRHGSTDT